MLALLIALSMWGLVGYLSWTLSGKMAAHMSEQVSVGVGEQDIESAIRVRTLARETKDLRTDLETNANREAISIVESIEAIEKDAGVDITIGEVLSEPTKTAASPTVPSLRTIGIAVEAMGSFREVMHAAALIHSLPVPSVVKSMQFERLSGDGISAGNEWRLVTELRVSTIADISS